MKPRASCYLNEALPRSLRIMPGFSSARRLDVRDEALHCGAEGGQRLPRSGQRGGRRIGLRASGWYEAHEARLDRVELLCELRLGIGLDVFEVTSDGCEAAAQVADGARGGDVDCLYLVDRCVEASTDPRRLARLRHTP